MKYKDIKISKLIADLKIHLKSVHYSDSYILGFVTVWDPLTTYMTDKNIVNYTAKTGMSFLEIEYGITLYKELSKSDKYRIRAINILSDFLHHGVIFPKKKQAKHPFYPPFQPLFQGYIDAKKAQGICDKTLRSHKIYLSRFSQYLSGLGVGEIQEINDKIVLGFVDTFACFSPSVIHNTLCSLRTFFHYLYQNNIVLKNFAYIVPHDGYRQNTKVPSYYCKQDIEKILLSIDRGNPKGKRDYAMILLAARLGLRAQDICNLSFSHLKWETNSIELTQHKTKKLVTFPILEEIGLAIIDYLKYARPSFEQTQAIFLRLTPPVNKLSPSTLHSIVTQHMRNAGVKVDNGKKHGPHALRHSLASALLEDNTPIPVISEILGHSHTDSTSVYLKIDINQLKPFSLTPALFDWNKGEELF